MTRDEIIKLIREAGISTAGHPMNPLSIYMEEQKRFVALVAAAERERIGDQCAEQIKAAIEDEREACAKVCDEQGVGRKALEHYAALTYSGATHDCAAAIRARGVK